MAATADLPGSTYVGPDGFMEWGGHPRVTSSTKQSYDETAQRVSTRPKYRELHAQNFARLLENARGGHAATLVPKNAHM